MSGLPRWLSGKESACQHRRHRRCGFNGATVEHDWACVRAHHTHTHTRSMFYRQVNNEGKKLTLECLLCANTSNIYFYLIPTPHFVPHTYLILLCIIWLIWLMAQWSEEIHLRSHQLVNVVSVPFKGVLWSQCAPLLAVITEVLVPSEETWAGPTTWEQWKILSISAIESTSFKLPFMGRKEKGRLILPLSTYKGFCFALLFVPLILIALNTKICTRPHWVFNTDFWCSKLKPWFLCLWEPLFCLQNAIRIILKTLGWGNDHNFPHIQTSS